MARRAAVVTDGPSTTGAAITTMKLGAAARLPTQAQSFAMGGPPAWLRRYVGAPGRQVHITEVGDARPSQPSLYCLHATAYSGRSFTPLMAALATSRRVLAPDTPGYGASDPPETQIELADYAERMGEALALDSDGRIDLLGYHTGALLAAELARQRPELIRRVVLIGVPYFEDAEREHWRGVLAKRMSLSEDLEQFEERWRFFITDRRDGVTLARGFENFVDELRAYPCGWWAHEAAFTFDVRRSLSRVLQPVLVLNPDNHLSEASRQAAACLPNAGLTELPSLDHAIFDTAPTMLASLIDAFLSKDGQTEGATDEGP